jgi:hypothetical protein
VLAELQRLVHWAQAPPTSGEVQMWYARMVHLIGQYRLHRDEAGTLAHTLERELGALWTFVVEEGVEPTNNRAEVRFVGQKPNQPPDSGDWPDVWSDTAARHENLIPVSVECRPPLVQG